MKTIFARSASLALAAGLTLFSGCARSALSPEPAQSAATAAPPVVVAAPVPATPVPAAPAVAPVPPPPLAVAASAPAVAPAAPPVDTNPPAIIQRIPPVAKVESVPLSPGLTEVVKLAQAGVGEEVILAYIDQYAGLFNAGADQIVYLNDLGISSAVIAAMLKRDGSGVAATAPPGSLVQTQVVSNVPANQPAPPPAPATAPQVETAAAPAPTTSTEVSYFYDALSPYGSWIYLSSYGWCWQPTVAVSTPAWRPYLDRGRWYWSDSGWYWNSDYSWGWAPFHYGRWYHHGGCGWVWTPGLVWGPSWVSWRYSSGYYGWAPLPPAAYYQTGFGFTYYGSGVSVGFEFGLGAFHYSYVSVNNFCSPAPYRYAVPHGHHNHNDIHRQTAVVNNYERGRNNAVINRGVGRETIARAGNTPVREISVRETPVQSLSAVRGERIERRGNETVVYRPELPKTTPQVRTAPTTTRTAGASTVGRAGAGTSQSRGGEPATVGRARPVETPSAGKTTVANPPAQRAAEPARQPAVGARSRTETPVTGQRTTPSTAPRAVTGQPPQQAQPRTAPQQQQQQQPRQGQGQTKPGQTLFGDSGATVKTVPPTTSTRQATPAQPQTTTQSRTTARHGAEVNAAPRTAQPNYNVPAARVAPQAVPSQPTRVATPQSQQGSPRAYEQAPRAPQYSAPAAPPAPSAPARSSGGSPAPRPSSSGRGETTGTRTR